MIIPPRLCGYLTYLDCQSIHASWSLVVAAPPRRAQAIPPIFLD
jgi:hypothetical protein